MDPYGHTFNYFLHQVNRRRAIPDEVIELERKLKSREIQLLSRVAGSSGSLRRIDPVKLMRVHKKRLKLAQQGKSMVAPANRPPLSIKSMSKGMFATAKLVLEVVEPRNL